jgi:hypothetical protein
MRKAEEEQDWTDFFDNRRADGEKAKTGRPTCPATKAKKTIKSDRKAMFIRKFEKSIIKG